ncbi:hypothetical protein QZH41_016285 [Actinostola sp. cb2023]|nr:hypothetical protein QZH41_016285 [Actinostola sp. cb2023]
MSHFSNSTSLVGPRTKTLAEFEYKGLLAKKPLWNELYKAVVNDDASKVCELLNSRKEINLGAPENRGYTKLLLGSAIENDNDEILEVLIKKGAKIGGILFTAVRENSYKCTKCIVQIVNTTPTESDDLGPSDSKDEGFITPLMMAIHSNAYDIIEYLITQDYKIESPEYVFEEGVKNDLNIDLLKITRTLGIPLRTPQRKKNQFPKEHSILLKINTYQSLANPLYISYMFIHDKTEVNPLFEIFQLSKTLLFQSGKDEEFKEEYRQLSSQCEDFAVDLMEQCRTFKEIKILSDVIPEFETKRQKHVEIRKETAKDLAFLNLAIKGNNDKAISSRLDTAVLLDKRRVCSGLRPCYTSENRVLLCDSIFVTDWLIIAWVVGLNVQEFKELLIQGKRRYFSQWWNSVTLVMVLLFTVSYLLRLIAFGISGNWDILNAIKELTSSASFKIILLSNSLFSIGMVLSFIRLSAAFQANDKLGPLQLSLYHLILDVAKFMVFFALIILAFGFSLRKLYSHYISTQKYIVSVTRGKNSSINATDATHRFSNVAAGLNGLFWSLFGLTDLQSFSTKDSNFLITKETGEVLFGLFQVLAVIIAINMLIAMMTRSYDDIADNAIKKWKVSRTRLWMFWVEKGSVLPPPLNLIPNAHFLYGQIKKLCKCCQKVRKELLT